MYPSKLAFTLLACASFQFSVGALSQEYKYADVNGTRLAYIEAGAGDPAFLVHGGLQDLRFWKSHLDAFSKRYRAIAYSRRNHFPTDVSPDGTQDLAADVHGDDLAGLVEALGLSKVHVVAHSSGAHSALFFATKHPALLRSLTVVEPPAAGILLGIDNGPSILKEFGERFAPARDAFRKRDLENGLRLFADAVGGPGTYERRSEFDKKMMMDNVDSHIADAISSRPRPQFTCAMAGAIKVPALLIRGGRSPEFFGAILTGLARCLPDAQVIVVQDASHTVPGENPEGFQAAVLPFLAKH
jgi:non-heme chloroperoxidase